MFSALIRSAKQRWSERSSALLSQPWAWPSACVLCDRFQSHIICERCVVQHRPAPQSQRCRTCAALLTASATSPQIKSPDASPSSAATQSTCGQCLQHPPPWQAALAAVDYAQPWDELIARFKYQAEPALARHLAQIMLAEPLIQAALIHTDAVLPIPLSRERLAQRGYNQALELSKALVKGLNTWDKRLPHSSRPHLPPQLLPQTLLRLRDTREQKLLSQSQRALNVKGAFGLSPFATAPLPARVLLIDDVMTSGASLREASQVLLANGVQSVNVMVFARTPLH